MRAAGVDRFGAEIRLLELPEPTAPGPGEVLLGVQASGMGNWDEFIRTGGQAGRARALGAAHVIDYHEPDWPAQVRALTSGGAGVDAAVNAARSGSADAVRAVRDGGRLATITADLPPTERGIALSDIVVVPDGTRLARLVPLLAPDAITVGASYPLAEAAAALARLRQGTHGAAIVLEP